MKVGCARCHVVFFVLIIDDLICSHMKAGIIEEMMEDTLDGVLDHEDDEEEADAEVDKVLGELTAGMS